MLEDLWSSSHRRMCSMPGDHSTQPLDHNNTLRRYNRYSGKLHTLRQCQGPSTGFHWMSCCGGSRAVLVACWCCRHLHGRDVFAAHHPNHTILAASTSWSSRIPRGTSLVPRYQQHNIDPVSMVLETKYWT